MPRVFFALWPDARLRARLATLVSPVTDGRAQPAVNLHITLCFVGSVSDAELARLEQADFADLPAPFELVIDHAGWWSPGGIAWVGPSRVPPALTRLHGAIARGAGITVPAHESFRPHVTLARRAARPPLSPPAPGCRWMVRDFRLVVSEHARAGSRYRCTREWSLGGARTR